MEEDKACDLPLRARTNGSGESLLRVYQTITSTSEKLPLQPLPVRPTLPSAGARQRRDPDVQPQPSTQTPPGPPSAGTSHGNDCLLRSYAVNHVSLIATEGTANETVLTYTLGHVDGVQQRVVRVPVGG
jgi:hypothetical protein